MYRKSEEELEKAAITKVTRTLIRLKHSLAADKEINDVLPDRLIEFDKALNSGRLLTLPEGWEGATVDEVRD